jgi:hypothetical protein
VPELVHEQSHSNHPQKYFIRDSTTPSARFRHRGHQVGGAYADLDGLLMLSPQAARTAVFLVRSRAPSYHPSWQTSRRSARTRTLLSSSF